MWIQVVIGAVILGTYIYHRLTDHPYSPQATQIKVPQVAQGTPVPLLYGRCRIRASVLVWTANFLHPGQVFTRVFDLSTGTADHYSLDTLFVLGVPFYGGGTTVLFRGWAGDADLSISLPPNSTGPFAGGDLSGSTSNLTVDGICAPGVAIQDAAALAPVTGSTTYHDGVSYNIATNFAGAVFQSGAGTGLVPGYRNQMVMYMHVGLGLSADVPSFSWEVGALSTGSASDMGQSLASEADPAAVLYDLLTSPWGKLAIPASFVEKSTFQAASLTLFNENHGYSRCIDQAEDADSIIQDILKQIDGVMYPEPTTGKIELHLVRNDYVVGDLVDINPSNATLTDYSVQSWSEMPNQVRLMWTSRLENYSDAVALAQNMSAAIGGGNRLRSVTIQYKGCCTAALAQTLASRELAVISRPLAKATVECNREFYQARPGSVYTLTMPELGISGMVMRVGRVNLGQLHQNKITLSLIRDVFDTTLGAFPPP